MPREIIISLLKGRNSPVNSPADPHRDDSGSGPGDHVEDPFDPELLEGVFHVEMADQPIELQSHRMVFNPTSFGRNLAPLLAARMTPGMSVCEVGIGGGVLCILAGKLGAGHVTGLDINPHAVHMARRNWVRNGLPEHGAQFLQSRGFGALGNGGSFDLVWSNPPVLPVIDTLDQAVVDRDGFEVAGAHGRGVLDGMLKGARARRNPGGRLVTIATSLQGWLETVRLLESEWGSYQVLQMLELELTDECGPPYIDWWLGQEARDGEARIYQRNGKWLHKVWYLEARP